MLGIDQPKTKEQLLLEAFEDKKFQEKILKVRLVIEQQIEKFIDYLKNHLKPEQRIFESIETRIKKYDSFKEKIRRKNYTNIWKIDNNIKKNQAVIAKSLPDLIGCRITCFFWQDEEVIYKYLKDYYDGNKFLNIKLDFSENKIQKNGHIIYKVSGIYLNKFCFEIQIKSIMHNIWGEVEHKTIYKNKNYDPHIEDKKTFTEEIFNILHASDKQLLTIFREHYDERELLRALFFEKTKGEILQKTGNDILAAHYTRFFQLFSTFDTTEYIKKYIISALQNKRFKRIDVDLTFSNTNIENLKNEIKTQFSKFNMEYLFSIASLILKIDTYDEFLTYLAQYLWKEYHPSIEIGDEEFEGEDAFDEREEETIDTQEAMLVLLDEKIGGRNNGTNISK